MILEKHLCLLGFMGSGKSTIGKALAERLGFSWVDSDSWIEAKLGQSIIDFVIEKGWPAFRALEREFTYEMNDKAPMVISFGGGFPLDIENWNWISRNCTSIYLRVETEELLKRLVDGTSNRPLLQQKEHGELIQFINEELTNREPVYTKANYIIDGNGTVEETLQRIKQLI